MNLLTSLSRFKLKIKLNTLIRSSTTINLKSQLFPSTVQHTGNITIDPIDNAMVTDAESSVHIQVDTKKEMMVISFQYPTSNNEVKRFHLSRKTSEPLSYCLNRIKLNLQKFNKSRDKKKPNSNQESAEELQVQIICDGKLINPEETDNLGAWVEGRVLNLNGRNYNITTNRPHVESLKLPSSIMTNFIAIPLISLKNCMLDSCKFAWYRRIFASELKSFEDLKADFDGSCYWIKLSEDFSYSPTSEDTAHHLKFVCYPIRDKCLGFEASTTTESPVELGPSKCPFEKRHEYTKYILPDVNDMRVVTYNILADLYADSEYSRTVLFGHCPSYALNIDYRRQLLLKEISGYNADIICLQEVDKKEYTRTYYPYFNLRGNYDSVFDTKGGQVAEGTGTFFRRDKFKLLESHRTILSELIDPFRSSTSDQPITHPILDDPSKSNYASQCLSKFEFMRKIIMSNQALAKRFLDRHTMIQTSLLKLTTQADTYLLLSNTHLYFAPDADHIRLLQGSTCTKYLEFLKNYYQETLGTDNVALVLCGDMNSTPDCGLYKLLTTGSVSRDLPDWSSNEEEAVCGLDVETNLRFQPAYKNISYTNYTKDFNGCLDYIYYECDKLSCKGTVPLPDSEDVTAIGGIPSDVFPSDHLALIANLRFETS